MTGYGKYTAKSDGRELTVEMKSVNSRFLDLNIRTPKGYVFLEETVRRIVNRRFKRGSFDIYLTYADTSERAKTAALDTVLTGAYVNAAAKLSADFGVVNDFSASILLRMPDILTITEEETDQSILVSLCEEAVENAASALAGMRRTEGAGIRADLTKILGNITSALSEITCRAPGALAAAQQKLEKRLNELLAGVEIDQGRLLTEVAVIADKSDINEEISRLNSHIAQFADLLNCDDSGKKLDFLSQEMLRETNTIGSKAGDQSITESVLYLKNEIEKLKEQIRNVE